MNLDFAIEVAKMDAEKFSMKYQNGNEASAAYNGYLAGRMECIGERESLRQIAARVNAKVPVAPADKSSEVDDFI